MQRRGDARKTARPHLEQAVQAKRHHARHAAVETVRVQDCTRRV